MRLLLIVFLAIIGFHDFTLGKSGTSRGRNRRTTTKPVIIGISSADTYRKGERAILGCRVLGRQNLRDLVSWIGPNHTIHRFNRSQFMDRIFVTRRGALIVRNVSKIDDGTYSCVASNDKGSTKRTTEIIFVWKCLVHCRCQRRTVDCSRYPREIRNLRQKVLRRLPADIIKFRFNKNRLRRIKRLDLSRLRSLEMLFLKANVIKELDAQAFLHQINLTHLYLERNKLTEIIDGTFSTLSKLKDLSLRRNKLSTVRKGMFQGLSSLKNLYLFSNRIVTIGADAFEHLVKVEHIDLAENQLTSIPEIFLSPAKKLPMLSSFALENNPFHCDCAMEGIRVAARSDTLHKSFVHGISCSSSEHGKVYLQSIESNLCKGKLG